MNTALDQLLRDPRIWRGGRARPSLRGQRTGFPELDRHLPGRGWPDSCLIELLQTQPGIGELRLLIPSLRQQTQCWVAPPWIPYAPALAQSGITLKQLLVIRPEQEADALWALEQVLRSGVYAHVLSWNSQACERDLRRLQLAAEHGGCRLFLFRSAAQRHKASPAALRLFLEPADTGLDVRILKCRGGQPTSLRLPFDHADTLALHRLSAAAARRPATRAA